SEARVKELEQPLAQAKEEMLSLYKSQSANAQKLLNATENTTKQEEELKRNEVELSSLKEANKSLMIRVDDLSNSLKQKDETILLLQDELSTLQLEMDKSDERMKSLENDNRQLVERWLRKMNE